MNTNKPNNIEFDDMKIKAHLNASLDKDGINVSEDLINRTLAAIRSQRDNPVSISNNSNPTVNKIIPFSRYVRSFAGIAAALLLVVGVGAFMSSISGSKSEKDMDNKFHSSNKKTNRETASKDENKEDSFHFTNESTNDSIDDTSRVDSFDAKPGVSDQDQDSGIMSERDEVSDNLKDKENVAGNQEETEGQKKSEDKIYNKISFSDIIPISLDNVEAITMRVLSDGTAIDVDDGLYKEVYSILTISTYSIVHEPASEGVYDIIIDSSEASYQIVIGDKVSIKNLNVDEDNYRVYLASDHQKLIDEINAFISNEVQ